jgi:hypothetical protein
VAGAGLVCALGAFAGCTDRGDPVGAPPPDSVPPPFRAADTCGGCHPQHLVEWEASMHAFGGSDPLMLAMSELAREEVGETLGASCQECHSPARIRLERWLAAGNVPSEQHPLEDLETDGINCDVCHSVSVVPPVGEIGFLNDVDPRGPKLAGISSPVRNSFHESLEDDSFRTSIQCASCHQVNMSDGTGLENTYKEWESSVLSGMGIECQDCHMPAYQGPASPDGPTRTLHRHQMVGPDYAYEPFRGVDLVAQKEAIRTLMRNAVVAELTVPPTLPPSGDFTARVTVTNAFTGHAIPSGVSFAREMWIELVVRDAADRVIHSSGELLPNGDLPADPDLAKFGAVMHDAEGNPTFFTWRARSIDESGLLQYGRARTAMYTIDVPESPPIQGPLTVQARLRFRPVSPAMVRMLDLERLLPIEIFEMWTDSRVVDAS